MFDIPQKLHIVIPSAGLGKRFKNANYVDLKPFIKINGKTMFEHIISNILNTKSNIYIYQ